MPAHAARQAILVNGYVGGRAHRKLRGQRLAVQADADDGQALPIGVIAADAAEVHRQAFLQAAHDDLVDALEVEPVADGAGDLVQQVQALELGLQPKLGLFALGDVGRDPENPLHLTSLVPQGTFHGDVGVQSVGLRDYFLLDHRYLRRRDALVDFAQRRGDLGREQVVVALAENLFVAAAEKPQVALVDHQVVPVQLLDIDDRRRVVDDRLQQSLALADGAFCAPALSDLAAQALGRLCQVAGALQDALLQIIAGPL